MKNVFFFVTKIKSAGKLGQYGTKLKKDNRFPVIFLPALLTIIGGKLELINFYVKVRSYS